MSRIAGRPPRLEDDALRVDYADVLRQAVENERFRILREVEKAAKRIAITKERNRYEGYGMNDRRAADYKADLLAALEGLQ